MSAARTEWREACGFADDAYRAWSCAGGAQAGAAYLRYVEALDAEQLAADLYAALVRRSAA